MLLSFRPNVGQLTRQNSIDTCGIVRKNSLRRLSARRVSRCNKLQIRAMHPDAIRRRKEFEERQRQTQERLKQQRKGGWWSVSGPRNLSLVSSLEELKQVFQSKKLVCMVYFSPTCAACKALHPKIIKIAKQRPDVSFIKLNVANKEVSAVCEAQGLTNVPYFQLVLEGDVVANFTLSFQTASQLETKINEVYKQLIRGQQVQLGSSEQTLNSAPKLEKDKAVVPAV